MKVNNRTEAAHSFTSTRISWVKKIKVPDKLTQNDEYKEIFYCNYTNLNRKDYNWEKLPKLLQERFEKRDKIKVNIFGCSDGSDSYTFIINMINMLGEKAKKFFPVLSSDISPDVITESKKGNILLHKKDLDYLQKTNALKYFETNNNEEFQIMRGIEFFPYKVKAELLDKIDFSVKDVRKEVKENDFSDSVFFFRNGWGFNTLKEQNDIAKSLYENSNSKTLVGIGQSDLYKSNASDALQRNKFKGIETDVFTLAETDYPGAYIGTPQTKPMYRQFGFFEK